MKVTDKLSQAHSDENAPATFSFEFFTPKTTQGVQNLYDRMDRMYELNPLFIDITWNAGGRLSTLTSEMVQTTSTVLGLETCMHLTCTNMPLKLIDDALQSAYNAGCQNILALRGDPPLDGSESTGDFNYAKDLINHIREKYGDYFCIGIAAYPEGHPEEPDFDKTMKYLKQKQDVGGDFIVTQMFYDIDRFINWCRKCKEYGITIPIIPGIMPISNYAAFLRRAKWSNIHIPQSFINRLDPIKEDDLKVREEGTKIIIEMCQALLDSKVVNHLHFYTMNLEKSTLMILEGLNLVTKQQLNDLLVHKEQPWRKSLNPSRENESVRPIFWQNRKFSYIQRTSDWDEFPNGRWGDSRSPAFGSVELCDHELIRHSPKKIIELWGIPNSIEDLGQLIIKYLQNDLQCLPWSDGKVSKEGDIIKSKLIKLNEHGIITVNSQPCVNGIKSSDLVYGWGPKNGYVYQKQYLEFLIPIHKLSELESRIKKINKESAYNVLTYFAISVDGGLKTNVEDDKTTINAVTWGCFPGMEVVQPTIVEKISFLAWKDEFYSILKKWSTVLNNDIDTDGKEGAKFINEVVNNYALVNIVDNDYVHGGDRIFELF